VGLFYFLGIVLMYFLEYNFIFVWFLELWSQIKIIVYLLNYFFNEKN
jgi:hypothetical protein